MESIPNLIIAMEEKALERWGNGDPAGFLEITDPDIVYFDPYISRRIDGIQALSDYYRDLWGKVHVDRFELINPKVQVSDDMAVLTFNYVSYQAEIPNYWNCTEVYKRRNGIWKIVQSHWSYTQVFERKSKNFKD